MDAIKQLELANVKVYKNAKETGRLLGIGSFGCVVELTIKGAGKFAGKKIHEALIVDGDTSLLVKECKLMSELIHPNIAKFYGVCKLPSRTAPALVMELMDHSLEDFLENKTFHLPLTTATSILIDIANGLTYLHGRTPRVLHRDLTARNVLLDRYTNAKITDFGNARIIDAAKIGKTMTQAPGTSVYMPPEALDPHTTYCDRLDIFSFGHLALYTLIREFPRALLPATYIQDAEGQVVARSEVERRSKYMEALAVKLPELNHQLYQLTRQCLQNDPTKRPDATALLSKLQEVLCLEYGELYTTTDTEESTADADRKLLEDKHDGQVKTGLIEKKSRMLSRWSERGTWRAHTFTVDYKRGTFQYTRSGSFPAKGPVIQLDNITEVKELEQDGPRFPFEVHHKGKYSPWELRVYSEVQRREWKERIQMHPEATSPPLTRSEKEKEDIDASIDECIYDKIIDVLNNRFNPCQLDEFTKKLQTHTYSTLPAEGRILPTIKSPPMDQPALSLQKLPVVPPPPETELPLLPPKPPRKRLKEPLADKTLKQPSPTSTPEGSMLSLTVDPALPMLRKTQRSMSLPSVEHMPLDVGKLPTQSPQKPTATELPLLPPKPPRKKLKEPLADKTLKQPSPTSTPEGSMFSLTVDPALPMLRKTQRSMSLPSVEHMPLDVGKLPTQSPQKPTATELPLLPPKPPRKKLKEPLADKTLKQPSPTSTPEGSMFSLTVDPALPMLRKTQRSMSLPSVEPMPLDVGKLPTQSPQKPTATELPLLPPKPPRKKLKEPVADKTLKQPSPTSTPEGSMLSLTVDPALPMLHKTQRSMSLPSVEPMPLDVGKLPTQSPQKPTATEDYEDMDYGLVSEQSSRLAPAQLLPPTLPPRRLTSSCASLEALQREALAISLSSLTDVTKIGEGQFGDVYTAKMNRCTVAVKVIKRYSSKRVKEQFENEMSIMSQVSHHNIVRLHGIIRDGPLSPALVMEFLRNGDLKTFLSREPQTHEFLMKCMSDIAMGMHYLCERGLIHRDLAARNVLLDDNKTCKVSDFGLLREVPKDKNVYISQGDGPSPLRWMAPESITDNIFSPATDVWSFGIVQWEMFFPGKHPYHDMQTTKMIVKVASGYRMPIPRGCPALAAKIMKACWKHDPNERPTFLLISNLLSSRDRLLITQ